MATLSQQLPRYVHVLPADYVQAIGEVVVSWSFFEVDLDAAIQFFRLYPDARNLAEQIPSNIKRRLKLFRHSADASFAQYPAVRSRFSAIGQTASHLAAQRHDLAHARWRGNEGGPYSGYSIRFGDWGTARQVVSNKDEILRIARQINEMHFDLCNILGAGFPKNSDELLLPEEITAMKKFRADHVPPLPIPAPMGWHNLP